MYKHLIALTAATSLSLAGCSMFGGDKPEDTAPPTIAPVEQAVVEPSLLEQIDNDISSWRLTSPKGNNAAEKLATLRALDPESPAIPSIKSKIVNRYVELADRTLSKPAQASSRSLKKALRFINTARKISPNAPILDKKEQEIADLLDISKQREQLAQAKAEAAKKKAAAAQAQRDAEAAQAAAEKEQAAELAALKQQASQATKQFDPSKPPSSMMMKMPPKPASTENLLVFDQVDVDNQSQALGLEIDNLSRRIIEKDAAVIVHAKSEKDYRWINGSLKTSIYLMRSDYNLKSSPKIGANEHPSIEIVE